MIAHHPSQDDYSNRSPLRVSQRLVGKKYPYLSSIRLLIVADFFSAQHCARHTQGWPETGHGLRSPCLW